MRMWLNKFRAARISSVASSLCQASHGKSGVRSASRTWRRWYQCSTAAHDLMMDKSVREKEAFWAEAAKDLHWDKAFEKVVDESDLPFAKWFVGGKINVCYNAVDRWVEAGRGDDVAIYYDSPVTKTARKITFRELQHDVAHFAGALTERGVVKGDRVIIYMPMIPEAVVAMLACARIGAVHSVVFGGFAPKELATRIDDAKPKVIISASCGVEPTRVVQFLPLLKNSIKLASHKPESVIVKYRPEVKAGVHEYPVEPFEEWNAVMFGAIEQGCVPVSSTDPLYLLYTSGTTAQPKGVLRDSGGYATALRWSMKNFMGLNPGDTYWAASDIGWVVGHSYIVYGPLLHGCSTVLYEGKPILPDAGVYWRVIQDYKVNALFTAPTAARAIRKVDPTLSLADKYDLSSLRTVFLAGERADPATVEFISNKLEKPVVDNYWQTELGWPALGFHTELGTKPGSAGRPVPGYDMCILCEESSSTHSEETLGDVCIKLPLPPGCFLTLNNADERCKEVYYSKHQGYYLTGDAGFRDSDGYYHIMSRTDDVINVAAHRLSSGSIEEVLSSHPLVAESAVIGVHDEEKGQVPVGFVVLKDGQSEGLSRDEIELDLVKRVREEVGPIASFKTVLTVNMLPKTRSGKILRGIMSKMADGLPYAVPGTIEDMAAVEHVEKVIQDRWQPTRVASN